MDLCISNVHFYFYVHVLDFFFQIRLGAITRKGTRTEWSKAFSLQAVGTSGRISALLGHPCTFHVCSPVSVNL